MGVFNSFLYARDSFFWDKRAFAEGAWDVTKAKIWHFLHETDTSSESRVLESVQSPLENRVWYNYPGQLINYRSFPGDNWLGNAVIGTTSQPSLVGRVLDDGTTQLYYYQYNLAGNLTNYTDPMGRSFTYLYATNNIDLLQSIMTRNGKNEVQGSITYNSLHLPLTVTDASGQTTVNTYNSHGQILSITNPKGETATFSYSTNGYLSAITGPLQTAGDTVSFTYDAFGRILTTTDTQGYTLTYNYDAADRTTRITHPDGTYEQFVYSNLDLVAFADRLGRWTTNTYNADQQLVETRDPLGRMTAFQWCKCGSLTGITDPMGRTTTWDYDLESRPVAKHFPDGSSITYIYESAIGRLQSRFDEQGQQSFYEYYADNHLKRVSYPNAAIATPVVTWTYDPDYNRVLTMEDGIGTTVYSYNPISSPAALGAGQLASVAGPLPNSTVTYQYDQLGRVTSRAVNGVAMATTYDALSRPTVITNALGTFQQTFVAATSQPASEIYPNGQTNLFAYYGNLGDERLREITHLYPNGSLLSAFGYSYNAAGQITSWTNQWDTLPTRVWLPSYDAADQLTNIASLSGPSAPINYSYSYDTSGNRTLAQSNAVPNQFDYNDLNQITGVTLGPTNSVSYEWDAARRLTAVTQGALRSEFSYDGMGRRARILEMSNGVVTMDHYFLWTGTELCEERDATGAAVTRRFFPQGECIIGAGGTTNLFYTRDHLGSVREALNQAGALQARSDYDPYGQQTVLTDILLPSFAFTGHYQHQPTGLYLTLYRALDPRAGRWLSRDPLAEAAGLNLYAYLGNDPLMGRDPLGEDWTDYIPSERTLEKANNFAAGFADTITFSISGRIRRAIYPCDGVNTKSGYYTAGVAGGVVWQVALTGALGAGKTAAAKSAVVVEEAATEGAAGATAVEAHVEFAELFNYSGAQNGAGAAYSAALEELGADTALEEVVDGGVSGVMRVAEAAEAGEASAEALAAAENYNNAWSAFMGWLQAGGNSANLATKLKALESCRRAFGLAAFP
jgi:RHS repeat-associated protein